MAVTNEDLLALQDYVTATDSAQYSQLHPDTLLLDMTHSNLIQRHAEIRFDRHDTISHIRSRINRQTGTPPNFQHLQMKDSCGTILHEIPPNDEDRMLGYYNLENGYTVHCIDLNPHSSMSANGALENVNLVEKYRMSDEEYNKRSGTLRDWSRKQKERDPGFNLAKHARLHRELMEARRAAKVGAELPKGFEYGVDGEVVRIEEDEEEIAAAAAVVKKEYAEEHNVDSIKGVDVGMRCEVNPGGRRGEIKYVGEIMELGGGGFWVGVLFDEPVGKTNGTVLCKKSGSEKHYFDATPGCGGFIRGKNVTVGDFPERDIMDEFDSDDSEDEL